MDRMFPDGAPILPDTVDATSRTELIEFTQKLYSLTSAGSYIEVGGVDWHGRRCDIKHPWSVGGPRVLKLAVFILTRCGKSFSGYSSTEIPAVVRLVDCLSKTTPNS